MTNVALTEVHADGLPLQDVKPYQAFLETTDGMPKMYL